jgi:branched-chain amino acid aminotransferase
MTNYNYNGTRYSDLEPIFDPNDRIVKYNDGVFASMRCTGKTPDFLALHLKRLYESAIFLQLKPFPPFKKWQDIPLSFWETEIERVFGNDEDYAEMCTGKQAYRVRIQLYRDGSGLFSPTTNEAGFCITMEAIEALEQIFKKGLTLGFSKNVLLAPHAQPEYTTLKMPNSLPYILANIERQAEKLDEILIFDSKDYLVEGGSSNIICFAENTLFYTDHVLQGGYSGITQEIIINEIAPLLGISTQKMRLHKRVLPTVNEILVVNAVQGIRFVKKLKVENEVFTYKNSTTVDTIHELHRKIAVLPQ